MILIFGGTTEGRLAVEVIRDAGKPFWYATKGDGQQVDLGGWGKRHTGAMDGPMISSFCEEHDIKLIVDAAHPFASGLHTTLERWAPCPVVRFVRSEWMTGKEELVLCSDWDDAVAKLEAAAPARLLALTGVNTIARLRGYWEKHSVVFRILNRPSSMDVVARSGFSSQQLVFYEGCAGQLPTVADEMALMQRLGVDAMITKESGREGGLEAKVEAARRLGLKVFLVKAPPVRGLVVHGRHSLRRMVERMVPKFFELHTGMTTGTCALAATRAALLSLMGKDVDGKVEVRLPDGDLVELDVELTGEGSARVVKDWSDDPDVTRGAAVTSEVKWREDRDVVFHRGQGVGEVTLPGLGIEVGEAAINPVPRREITSCVRALTDRGCDVTIGVEDGEQLARHTFNERVGVVGGISILGTEGVVMPLSNEAFVECIGRELEVARAVGAKCVGLVSGKRGENVLRRSKGEGMRIVHTGNFVGEALRLASEKGFAGVCVGLMIGKAVKLTEGHLDTHSHKVSLNWDFLRRVAGDYADRMNGLSLANELWDVMPDEFFDEIRRLCVEQCRKAFPNGDIEFCLLNNE